jgi:hypothetical protein
MKKLLLYTAAFGLTLLTVGCGGGGGTGNVAIVDIEAAIDNPRTFDLAEIAQEIEFIPLDDTQKEGLLGNIRILNESPTSFYIQDSGWLGKPVTVFDRTGKFVATRGRAGRGPDEFLSIWDMTVDYDTDHLYLSGLASYGISTTVVYDPTGREVARADTVAWGASRDGAVVHKGKFIVKRTLFNGTDGTPPGTRVPFIETYSTDLKHETTIETTVKGISFIRRTDGVGRAGGASLVFSDNGNSLLVKEPLSDTVYYYRDGALTSGYLIRSGKYAMPAGSMGVDPTVEPGRAMPVREIRESDRYLFVKVEGFNDADDDFFKPLPMRQLVFDRRNLAAGGFSALGPGGRYGLFLGGITFWPLYVRDNRLVGYMRTLDIVDNAARITNPQLKALAATLKEDSNPVVVIATLKK